MAVRWSECVVGCFLSAPAVIKPVPAPASRDQPHTEVCLHRAQKPGHRGSFLHALRIRLLKYKMETESGSSTSGDDSVFCLDSEVMMDSEEGEMEDNFR